MKIIEIQASGNRDEDQKQTALAVLGATEDHKYVLLDVQTGGGKTRICKIIQELSGLKTTALVNTISNQNNYVKEGFALIKGGSNYDCELLEEKADSCPYESRRDCSLIHVCHLEKASTAFKLNKKSVANYSYFLTRGNSVPEPFEEEDQTQLLFLDEAHTLIKALTEETAAEFTYRELDDLGIFWKALQKKGDSAYPLLFDAMEEAKITVDADIKKCRDERRKIATVDPALARPSGKEKHLIALSRKIKGVLSQEKPIFLEWNANGLRTKSFLPMPISGVLENYDVPVVLATGTFGDYQTFTELLGIDKNDYAVIKYPYRFTPQECFVKNIFNEEISYPSGKDPLKDRNKTVVLDNQAKAIAETVDKLARNKLSYCGLILVNSYDQAEKLAFRLNDVGLSRMEYIAQPKGLSSEKVIEWWEKQKLSISQICLVSPTLWEGYDGNDEAFCILAKAPFPSLGDDYIVRRMKEKNKVFTFEIALQIVQGIGRPRRGKAEHYGVEDLANGQPQGKFVAIADKALLKYSDKFGSFVRQSLC